MQIGSFVGVAVALLIIATGVWQFTQRGQVASSMSTSTSATVQEHTPRDVPAGWREYHSATYQFSLLFPQELSVSEYAEGGNAMTIIFQNSERGEGFQIFIVPYSEQIVSKERFMQDVPTGVMRDKVDMMLDGTSGVAFYSTNLNLGDTYEMWFIRSGYLYEVTTLKPLDTYLQSVMQTWKFQ